MAEQQVCGKKDDAKITSINPYSIDYKITHIWKDNLLRKIFLDIIGNSQFRQCKYLKKDFCKKLSVLINQQRLTDNDIYDNMYDWVHQHLKEKTRKLLLHDNNKYRSANRAEKIQELVKKYLNTPEKPKDTSDLTVLDIGCAEGAITVMVGKYMKLDPQQVHGCDIENITDDNPYQHQFTFTHLADSNSYRLPYKNDSYHAVLAMMSLHHVPNKKAMLREIYRVLKPGGVLIIREHHCISKGLSMVLDVIHGFYSMVWANPREMDNFDDYYANYTHSSSLTKMLKHYNLKEKYNNHLTDYPKFYRGKIINPLSYYYGAYEKVVPKRMSYCDASKKRNKQMTDDK